MTEHLKEQLSAMMDNQLPEKQQEFLAARLARDKELAGCWYRYHLISDTLRGHLPNQTISGFSELVRRALDNESSLGAVSRPGAPAWLKSLVGLAVAASVAVVAILGVQTLQTGGAPETLATAEELPQPVATAEAVSHAVAPPPQALRVPGIRWNDTAPRVADQLNSYLINHGEYAASGGMPGIGPHVRIVGYDTSQKR